nr:hypothetical protein [Mycoplasmopsis gallinacea]
MVYLDIHQFTLWKLKKVSKAITNKEIYADFGFKNKQDALDNGVEIGDRVYLSGETIHFKDPNLVGGKSMDNRAGVTVLEFIAKEMANKELDVNLYLVWTVQEEVGTRGAKNIRKRGKSRCSYCFRYNFKPRYHWNYSRYNCFI